MKKHSHKIGFALGAILFVIALFTLYHQVKSFNLEEILTNLSLIPRHNLIIASLLTVAGYTVLTGYDFLALYYIGRKLSSTHVALTSFIGYSFSHNLGFSLLSGAPVRYRLYSSEGLGAYEIANIVAFCGLTYWLGFFVLGSVLFWAEPLPLTQLLHLPFPTTKPLGAICILVTVSYLFWCLLKKKNLRIKRWEIPVPNFRIYLLQIVIAIVDWIVAGLILYYLLPIHSSLTFPEFMEVFMLAQLVALISQVPGGLGVFESIILLLLSEKINPSAILGSLLIYRGIYYLMPFILAVSLLGLKEFKWVKLRL